MTAVAGAPRRARSSAFIRRRILISASLLGLVSTLPLSLVWWRRMLNDRKSNPAVMGGRAGKTTP
jgi:hypothetical protein